MASTSLEETTDNVMDSVLSSSSLTMPVMRCQARLHSGIRFNATRFIPFSTTEKGANFFKCERIFVLTGDCDPNMAESVPYILSIGRGVIGKIRSAMVI